LGFGIGGQSRRIVVSVDDRVQVIDITDGALLADFQLADLGGPVAVENGFDCQGQCQAFVLGPNNVHIVDITDLDPADGVRSSGNYPAPVGKFLDFEIAPGPSGTTRMYVTELAGESCVNEPGDELRIRALAIDPQSGDLDELGSQVAGCVNPATTQLAGLTWNADRDELYVAVPGLLRGTVARYKLDYETGQLSLLSTTEVPWNPVDVTRVKCWSGPNYSEQIVVVSNGGASVPPALAVFDAASPPAVAIGNSLPAGDYRAIDGHPMPMSNEGGVSCDSEDGPVVFLADAQSNRIRVVKIVDGNELASTDTDSYEGGTRIQRDPLFFATQWQFAEIPDCPPTHGCGPFGCTVDLAGECSTQGTGLERCLTDNGEFMDCAEDTIFKSNCPCRGRRGLVCPGTNQRLQCGP
jgi:hypothetical protein